MDESERFEANAVVSIGAVALRQLLNRLGYPPSKHVSVVCELTGLSKPQSGRRVNGTSQWSIDDFALLCKKLDVDYVEALELAVEPPLLKATFKSGQDSLPCRIRIGELVERPLSTDVLATKTNVGWVVSKGIKAEKAYSVSKLVIDVKGQEPGPKIAVFDDSQDACDSMCDALEVHGFQVQPYYALENLMRDTNSGASFDGMVIDWLVGAGHVGKELEILSRRFPTVPIIVLTGLDPHGAGGAADLASVVARTGAIYFAKPAVTSILVAALMPRAIAHYEQRLGSSR